MRPTRTRRGAADGPREPSLFAAIPALRRQAVLAGALALPIAAAIVVQAAALAAAVDAGLAGRDWSTARGAIAALVGAVLARAALTALAEIRGRRAGGAAMADLRARIVGATLRAGAADRGARRAGELGVLLVQGGDAVERWAGRVLPQMALAVTVPGVALTAIAVLDPLSAALLAPTLPLLILFLVLAGGDARRVAQERSAALSLLGAHLLDVVRGLPLLRSVGREHVQSEQLDRAGRAYRTATMQTLRSAFVSSFALEFVAMLGTALVAVVAGVRLVDGSLAFAPALTVLLLAPEIYGPLRRAGVEYHAAADARATLTRLLAVLGTTGEERPPGRAVPGHAERAVVRVEGAVVRPDGADRDVLRGLDLELRRGEIAAVVGPSGSGKSTLLRVLLGLQPLHAGRVRCGPTDLQDLDPDAWRAGIAWMPQRPAVLPATLAENLRLARGDADDAALWGALRDAGLATWAHALPGGLDARLGEGGVAVSAGERRRLALARVALRDPWLVLADEPTANLDLVTAALVRDTLARIVEGRTAVLVTHEPQLLPIATVTVRLDAGRVASRARAVAA
ncbi:thiol reductant ABC exporter subunit CydD [Conexibacter sp. W3-3-2]|uniref:thiol reductant ABC exporter subunit CydD n=1 Tax=Conexibacter sp. W3-3-2 TaxID=2675227 RepID=UPI0012B7E853|nr:thiol reductant ABC exporter subunit CydD [Conexibacter sp. W3-3-2]MTD43623.1 thiol reductant ABC exporter subunit CydD [Conexibacter sp. W3-3-2]